MKYYQNEWEGAYCPRCELGRWQQRETFTERAVNVIRDPLERDGFINDFTYSPGYAFRVGRVLWHTWGDDGKRETDTEPVSRRD